MFFFDADSFRALRIIPKLAQDLPSKHATIDWPAAIVDSIEKKSLVQITSGNKTFNSHPVGYFKTETGSMTNNISEAVSAFMVLEVGQNLYEQELLIEPEWMISSTSIINILRACLGDLHKLVGLSILDPITETIIINSYNTAKNIPISQTPISQAAHQMITGLQQDQANIAATKATIASAQQSGNIPAGKSVQTITQPATKSPDSAIPSTKQSNINKKNNSSAKQSSEQIVLPHASFLPALSAPQNSNSTPNLVPSVSNIISMISSPGAAILPFIHMNGSVNSTTQAVPKSNTARR